MLKSPVGNKRDLNTFPCLAPWMVWASTRTAVRDKRWKSSRTGDTVGNAAPGPRGSVRHRGSQRTDAAQSSQRGQQAPLGSSRGWGRGVGTASSHKGGCGWQTHSSTWQTPCWGLPGAGEERNSAGRGSRSFKTYLIEDL